VMDSFFKIYLYQKKLKMERLRQYHNLSKQVVSSKDQERRKRLKGKLTEYIRSCFIRPCFSSFLIYMGRFFPSLPYK
jgi:hypothetical protein